MNHESELVWQDQEEDQQKWATITNKEGTTIYVKQMFWMPEDKLEEKIREDHIPYDKWVEQGLLRLCEGNKVHYRDVTRVYRDWET